MLKQWNFYWPWQIIFRFLCFFQKTLNSNLKRKLFFCVSISTTNFVVNNFYNLLLRRFSVCLSLYLWHIHTQKNTNFTTYPSWTGPIAFPALTDSSDIKALVIDSVAPSPPSCYKFLRMHQQNKNQENWK